MNRLTLLLVFAGVVVRMLLIFPPPFASRVEWLTNKADLRNYYWPAQQALAGENPYSLWATGRSDGFRADMAPLELLVFVGTVTLWNDPRAIQILFALFDALNIVLLGVLLKRSRLRLPFQFFYALGPLTLYHLVLVPQDKTILLGLTFGMLILLQRKNSRFTIDLNRFRVQIPYSVLIIITAALVAAFKWLSVFYFLPLALFLSPRVQDFVKYGVIYAFVIALTHLPWFPAWAYVYAFRSARVAAPFHVSPAVLLQAVGVYTPGLLVTLGMISLLVVYALYWRKRIDIFEAIALATMAGILATPDMDPVHLALVVLSLLLIVNWVTRLRLAVIWSLSVFVSFIYAITTHAAFGSFSTAPLQAMSGAYASPQMILLSYALFMAVLAFYLYDKLRGRAVGGGVIMGEVVSE